MIYEQNKQTNQLTKIDYIKAMQINVWKKKIFEYT